MLCVRKEHNDDDQVLVSKQLQEFKAEVRDLTSDGRGVVSTPDGLTCFVAGVWTGETGTFKLIKSDSKVQQAALLELEVTSPHRREAPCKFHGHTQSYCGGCAWQFITYDAQLAEKQKRVVSTLERFQQNILFKPILASESEFYYRNRAQLKTNGVHIGFEAANSNALIAVDDCLVLSDKNRETLNALHTTLPNKTWAPKKSRPKNNKSNNKNKKRWTTLDIDEDIDATTVSVNKRLAFRQGNTAQNDVMQNWLHKKLDLLGKNIQVLELFCGSGNFTRVIADTGFDEIIAAEADHSAVDKLKQQALKNTQAFCVNLYLESELDSLLFKAKNSEVLVLDPPREGMKDLSTVCTRLRKLEYVYYISCNLATFSRDAKSLMDCGFILEEVQPVDLFPQTPHVEVLATFKNR